MPHSIASPMEESVVYLEGDVVVVVGVASKQKGTGVTVKGVADKSHGAGHCSHNNLVRVKQFVGNLIHLNPFICVSFKKHNCLI